MDKTQPSNKTFIGLIIGAIVLVAGLLLISNAGGGGSPTDVPSATQTRVALQPTATPESEASPIPGERRTTEEDPDGDGFIGETDFCPEVFGEFDGCPDTDADGIGDSKDTCIDRGDEGYGIDDTGCPNPPIDTDGDGVFDNDDTCPTEGDAGNGVDSVGCPIPVPSVDSDGDGISDDQDQCPADGDMGNGVDGVGCPIMVMIPDNAPAIMPYEFTGLPVDSVCSVSIVNVGDGDPLILGEENGLTPDASGNLSGAISILIGADDIPEAQVGCVPTSAPAIMPYEFTGLPTDATCTVTVINVGDADPAILGEETNLTPDANGNLSGNIGILIGAGDVPETQIGCAIVGDPVAIGIFEYTFTDQPTDAVMCDVVLFNDAQEQVAVIDALPNAEGVISGTYEFDPAQIMPTSAQVFCALESSPPAPGVLNYEFVVTGTPVCEVVIIDEADVVVIRIPETIDDGGIISGTYEYDPEVVPNPRAELACTGIEGSEDAVAINMGTVGACQIIEGAAVAVFTLTNPNNIDIYNGYTDQNGVAGEAFVPANGTNTINIIPNIDGFARIKFTGVSNFAEVTGCVVAPESSPEITPFPETTEIIPEETPAPELTPEATPAPELTPEATEIVAETTEPAPTDPAIVPVCYIEEGNKFVRFDVYLGDNPPAEYGYQFTSGIFAEVSTLPVIEGEPVFYTYQFAEGDTTARLVLIDGDNSWTSDADCTEIFALPYSFTLVEAFCTNSETSLTEVFFRITPTGDVPSTIFSAVVTSGDAVTNYPLLNFVTDETANITGTLGTGMTSADLVITDENGNQWDFSYDCFASVGDQPTTYELTATATCSVDGDVINFAQFRVDATGDFPENYVARLATDNEEDVVYFSLTSDSSSTFLGIQDNAGITDATLSVVALGESFVWTFSVDCDSSEAPEEPMVIYIDKDWYVSFGSGEGVGAPAEGYGAYAPDYNIPGLIIVTSDYGTLICDWFGFLDGDLECRVELITRPEWFPYFDGLPIAPGGSYTVTENVPDGWTTVSGVGTFSFDDCTDRWTNTQYYLDSNGEEQEITIFECQHEVVNTQDGTVIGDYYGIEIEKVWEDLELTARGVGGINSPALGGIPGPKTSYYPLITVTSSLGSGTCHWNYWNWNGEQAYLECYYDHNFNVPFDPNYLLVPVGESYTVTEVAIEGYINTSGLGTFTYESCMASQPQEAGSEGEFEPDIDVCRHTVVNEGYDNQDYYRVQFEKEWNVGNGGGLGAPALGGGGGDGPFYDIPNIITAESSIGIATCSWDFDQYESRLVCSYVAKDGQTMPDTTSLWVPEGETYTVTENTPDNWIPVEGIGTFGIDDCSYFYGAVCIHVVVNVSDAPELYLVVVDKAWLNFGCDEIDDCYDDCEYYDDCYNECIDCEANNGGLNAPASGFGGFESPGPATYIANFITVTTDLGSMTCSWVPEYYDSFFQVTFGQLDCRVTSIADGYPLINGALWASPGSSYTVSENVPTGYMVVFGTGTFFVNECTGIGAVGTSAQTIGEYYEEELGLCFHVVGNDVLETTPEPTPEITPTQEVTPIITPDITPDVTPEITPEGTVTPEPTPEITPEGTVTPEPTTVVTETPTDVVTPEVPTEVVTPEIPVGVCGDYTTDADGFPIINLSSRFCGGDSEGQVVNFEPIETTGDVCVAESLYHSNANGTWDIFRTSADTTPENLTNAAAGVINMAPSRSPNGRYVAFVSNADGDWEIYLLDLDGEKKLMQLTNNENAIDLDPVFSPSGRYIAYESNVDGNWEIRVIDLTTGEKSRVTNHPANDINPFWHPDGDTLAFQSDRTGRWQIFEASSIGGENRTRLISDGLGDDFDPTYNHAGTQIAFRSERNGEMGIYVMDDDGNNVTRISPVGYNATTPVWADGDRYIAYQASQAGTTLNDIFVYDTQTGETRQITSSDGDLANAQDVAPTWLCNSLTLIFASDVSGNNRIYALPILPMTDAPIDLRDVVSWTENEFNNRDPQNTPSEENGSRMGALPPRFIP